MTLDRNFQNCIEIYLRLGPVVGEAAAEYELDLDQGVVEWLVPRAAAVGMANHQREKYNFAFTGILGIEASQDVVFDTVARKVVEGALDGYNGTIFAYGQTGSGKTYTITGSEERYADRGLIPRTLSLIFKELESRTDYTYELHFAYLEIYNEIGYDLLNPDHETKALEDLPKVTMLEDGENCFHLRNLSQHLATSEEEALNLLFVGETNRMISATPMNLASSRSHCIFTITIEARQVGREIVRKSKLHIVDLAGSERVWKKAIDGQILREAKYINLSLHFLEQVIIALQERSQGKIRQHIPYRNSLMTSVLRDSIGGNCLTVMVATVTVAQQQLEETISTCRFAQRVALVSNLVTINEEIDPILLIKRLKQEIKDMKEELQLLRGDQERGPLTEIEFANLRSQINSFVSDPMSEAPLNCGGTIVQIRAAFQILKEMLKKTEIENSKNRDTDVACPTRSLTSASLEESVGILSQQLQERENEINKLVSFIRKREKGAGTAIASTQAPDTETVGEPTFSTEAIADLGEDLTTSWGEDRSPIGVLHSDMCREAENEVDCPSYDMNEEAETCSQISSRVVNYPEDRRAAFEIFRKSYMSWDDIEEKKSALKAKYAEAKHLGEQVNEARGIILEMKAKVEKRRMDSAIQRLVCRGDSSQNGNGEEDELIRVIEAKKKEYKRNFSSLKDLRNEIDHLHLSLEQSQQELRVDFDKWIQRSSELSLSTTSYQPNSNQWSSTTTSHEYEPKQAWQSSSKPAMKAREPHCFKLSQTSSLASKLPPWRKRCDSSPVIPAEQRDLNLESYEGSPRTETESSTPKNMILSEQTPTDGSLLNDSDVTVDINAFYAARAELLSR